MEKDLISVVMSNYNTEEAYLRAAIESVLNQTYKNFEFIIVDDGTPDNSGKICDEYAQKDSRIQVIHQENAGAPAARNRAIDIAKGKYLYFMDSDDWAEPEMLQEMYDLAEKNEAELVVTGFYIETYYSVDEKYTQIQTEEPMDFLTQQSFRENAYKLFDKNLLYLFIL